MRSTSDPSGGGQMNNSGTLLYFLITKYTVLEPESEKDEDEEEKSVAVLFISTADVDLCLSVVSEDLSEWFVLRRGS